MKYSKIIFPVMFAVLAGCAQAINTYGVGDIDAIPKVEYTAYHYSSGAGERLRAVFLKSPDSDIDVIPYSIQITTGKATPEEARKFMERGRYSKNIDYQGVTYKGKPIGYLLTYRYHSFSRDSIEINLFERDGKVYFSVWEKKYD
jgi:hypothetical protein